MKLSDLKPAPYNPRKIDETALRGLQASLSEFGDISGLVWNKRTGHLVAGHQRLTALREKYGPKLKLVSGAVATPDGQRFPVRIVDWPEDREKAANLAANSPFLAGSFDTAGLEAVLTDLNAAEGLGTLLEDLRLDELLPAAGDLLPEGTSGGADAEPARRKAAADEVPAGATEWITFSTPLTAAQHEMVMRAVRLAKEEGCERVGECLHLIASAFVKERADE